MKKRFPLLKIRQSGFIKLLLLLRFQTFTLLLAAALSIAVAYATLRIPLLVGRAIDCLVGPGQVDFHILGRLSLEIACMAAFGALAQFNMSLCGVVASYGVARTVRRKIFHKIEELPPSYFDGRQSGEIAARITTDAEATTDGLILFMTRYLTAYAVLFFAVYHMTSISVNLLAIFFVSTPFWVMSRRVIADFSYEYFREEGKARGTLAGYSEESAQGLRVSLAFNRAEASEREFAALDETLGGASFKGMFASSLANPAMRFVNGVIYAIVCYYGAATIISGTSNNLNAPLTVGLLVAFLAYMETAGKPLTEIMEIKMEMQRATVGVERVFEILDAPSEKPDPPDAVAPTAFEGRVEFDDVSFAYTPERPVIQGVNLDVAPGSLVAIVGPTGCGKTTLVNLLMRFYEVDSGAIRVDGLETRQIAREALRRGFGMVLQETWLKSGTIRENLAMGAEGISDEELWRVARACHIDGFIRRLPAGLDTVVSQEGDEFSQGERQLLCVARVMARNPNVLILDEATSSIDTVTEMKVQSAFNALMKGRTSFVVAHRLSTIRNADVILAMKDGAIVERGTHDELLAKRGFYYDLYNSQFPAPEAGGTRRF